MDRLAQFDAVLTFYDTHPISERQIIDKLRNDGHDLGKVTEDILQVYDQDHFGGVAANDSLAVLSGIDNQSLVLDVCCGLGGPSRYLARNYRCKVTGIDLTESRIEGAKNLTQMTGLSDLVSFECANALEMPFEDKTFDVVVSQEAFCHVPDKDRLIAECARVLKAGGRLAFTDILARSGISIDIHERLQREMTFQELNTAGEYKSALYKAGCTVASFEDLSDSWRVILTDRLAMYRQLKDQTVQRFGETHFRKWDAAYSFFVGLFQTGDLTGGRFIAVRN